MAGFLGFGNFQKPGKGVKKNEPEKKRFFQFFELCFRQLTKLIQLNLLDLLCCIPLSLLAGYYVYWMMVSVRLTFWQLMKNSYMFACIGIRTNVLTLLFSTGFLVCSILFIPYTIIVLLLITFSFSNLICAFNMRPYVYRYLMKPYYEYAGIPNPYEPQEQEEEPVFQDTTE